MAIVFKTPKSALNTTTKTIQNLGNGDCPPCPEVNLEAAELEYTQNGEYTVTPEQGVDGFSSIDVTVNIPSDVNNQNKTVNPSTSSQSVSADSGYSGLGTVTVNPVTAAIDPNIQAENILEGVTILGVEGSDRGYDTGYGEGESAGYENGYTEGEAAGHSAGYAEGETAGREAGYAEGEAAGEIAGAAAQKALLTSTTITQNGTSTREDGWNSVTVNVIPNLQAKTVNPSTSQQTVAPDQGKDGLSSVTVNAVTNAIDANIQAGNIKNGVSILGVTGSYNPQPRLQSKDNINPSTSIQGVSPDPGYDGLSYVGINGVTAAIDNNIQAGNIKNGVSILGVTGNVVEANLWSEEFLGDVTGVYTITPQGKWNGFDEVQITVESNPIGSFWDPFNCGDQGMLADVYNKLDEGGYFDDRSAFFGMEVESGSIDSRSGYYIAEDANGNSFAIEPYFDNPDYDPEADVPAPAFIFPENFDLSGLFVQVEADFANVTITENEPEDPMEEPTYTVEIALSTLNGINWNSDMES